MAEQNGTPAAPLRVSSQYRGAAGHRLGIIHCSKRHGSIPRQADGICRQLAGRLSAGKAESMR